MGMLTIYERGGEQDAIALVPMADGSFEAAEVPVEVRDRLDELRDGRETALSDLLYDRYDHPTAEARLSNLTRKVSVLREADTELRLAELEAERALQDQARQLRAQQAATQVEQQAARAAMPRWRQFAASILTLMAAHV